MYTSFARGIVLGSLFQLLLLLRSIPVNAVDNPEVRTSAFCYDLKKCGPKTWPLICKTGKHQSPINIPVSKSQTFQICSFRMNGHYLSERMRMFYGQNNGHTAQFELNPETDALMSDLKICGGHLEHCYKFAQLHFHWGKHDREGSEHTLNGQRFAMELHLVHYRDIYKNLKQALNSEDSQAVAVAGVLFKIGNHNKDINSIIQSLKRLKNPGKVMAFRFPLQISDFYPQHAEFAHYKGSLTTPTCDEKVVWTVFLQPMEISEEQISQFRMLSNLEGTSDINFRPIKNLNGRKIEYYRANGFTEIWDNGETRNPSLLFNSNN